ncbi:MAG: HepT-like ribonuclease domain-containing protein [Terriglobia bacterium]
MKDEIVYLQHILECIRRIEEDTRDGHEMFLRMHTLQDAVLRNLQILSESTQHLSDASKDKHPEIEWKRIAAFRNFLVHNYLGIDIERIWEIVQRDVPALKRAAQEMLEQPPRPELA